MKDNDNDPSSYLTRYKSSTRPQPCIRCGQKAYYVHPEWGRVDAACLLDLINIGEVLWKWEHYPLIWARIDYLISRRSGGTEKQKKSSSAKSQKEIGKKSGGLKRND
ncbi:MAG: hypothetical protein EBR38_08440 [Flavobacteriaceae bacterium]|nr:hypothetical protein [Flavobacteriaceae bacterium]